MGDMDEWLCVTHSQSDEEKNLVTTILTIQGLSMSGNSSLVDLSDVNLHILNRSQEFNLERKKFCFRPDMLTD